MPLYTGSHSAVQASLGLLGSRVLWAQPPKCQAHRSAHLASLGCRWVLWSSLLRATVAQQLLPWLIHKHSQECGHKDATVGRFGCPLRDPDSVSCREGTHCIYLFIYLLLNFLLQAFVLQARSGFMTWLATVSHPPRDPSLTLRVSPVPTV